jgi:transposase InsO family protein
MIIYPAKIGASKPERRARSAIFEWIEMFYNRERLHETLDYASPVRYEEEAVVP